MMGTNLADSAPSGNMDKLLTLMEAVKDPDRVTKAISDLKAAKADADVSIAELRLGKAAQVVMDEANALKSTAAANLVTSNAEVQAALDAAKKKAAGIVAEANAVVRQAEQATADAKAETKRAAKVLTEAQSAQNLAAKAQADADAEMEKARSLKVELEARLKKVNDTIASL